MLDHKKIYNELLTLVKEHKPIFVFNHIEFDKRFYRVFFYNYSTYEKFLLPSALECRGITFEVDSDGNFIRLASLPMSKFFNYKENPMTQDINEEKIDLAMFKEDGSLMSSIAHYDKIHLKSKGHLFSDQAIKANELLSQKAGLRKAIQKYENKNCTVNLEYTAPENQIVLAYQKPSLTVLNVRDKNTGEYLNYRDLKNDPDVEPFLVSRFSQYEGMTLEDFADEVKSMKDIEGFVVESNQQWIKFKTDWYCYRHNTIDTFNPFTKKGKRRIAEAILNEEVDDVKQAIENNKFLLDVIVQAEEFFADYLEETEEIFERFANENKGISRKDAFAKVSEYAGEDPVRCKYFMNRFFSPEKDFNLIEFVKKSIHGSNFTPYNDLMKNLKNPDPEIFG